MPFWNWMPVVEEEKRPKGPAGAVAAGMAWEPPQAQMAPGFTSPAGPIGTAIPPANLRPWQQAGTTMPPLATVLMGLGEEQPYVPAPGTVMPSYQIPWTKAAMPGNVGAAQAMKAWQEWQEPPTGTAGILPDIVGNIARNPALRWLNENLVPGERTATDVLGKGIRQYEKKFIQPSMPGTRERATEAAFPALFAFHQEAGIEGAFQPQRLEQYDITSPYLDITRAAIVSAEQGKPQGIMRNTAEFKRAYELALGIKQRDPQRWARLVEELNLPQDDVQRRIEKQLPGAYEEMGTLGKVTSNIMEPGVAIPIGGADKALGTLARGAIQQAGVAAGATAPILTGTRQALRMTPVAARLLGLPAKAQQREQQIAVRNAIEYEMTERQIANPGRMMSLDDWQEVATRIATDDAFAEGKEWATAAFWKAKESLKDTGKKPEEMLIASIKGKGKGAQLINDEQMKAVLKIVRDEAKKEGTEPSAAVARWLQDNVEGAAENIELLDAIGAAPGRMIENYFKAQQGKPGAYDIALAGTDIFKNEVLNRLWMKGNPAGRLLDWFSQSAMLVGEGYWFVKPGTAEKWAKRAGWDQIGRELPTPKGGIRATHGAAAEVMGEFSENVAKGHWAENIALPGGLIMPLGERSTRESMTVKAMLDYYRRNLPAALDASLAKRGFDDETRDMLVQTLRWGDDLDQIGMTLENLAATFERGSRERPGVSVIDNRLQYIDTDAAAAIRALPDDAPPEQVQAVFQKAMDDAVADANRQLDMMYNDPKFVEHILKEAADVDEVTFLANAQRLLDETPSTITGMTSTWARSTELLNQFAKAKRPATLREIAAGLNLHRLRYATPSRGNYRQLIALTFPVKKTGYKGWPKQRGYPWKPFNGADEWIRRWAKDEQNLWQPIVDDKGRVTGKWVDLDQMNFGQRMQFENDLLAEALKRHRSKDILALLERRAEPMMQDLAQFYIRGVDEALTALAKETDPVRKEFLLRRIKGMEEFIYGATEGRAHVAINPDNGVATVELLEQPIADLARGKPYGAPPATGPTVTVNGRPLSLVNDDQAAEIARTIQEMVESGTPEAEIRQELDEALRGLFDEAGVGALAPDGSPLQMASRNVTDQLAAQLSELGRMQHAYLNWPTPDLAAKGWWDNGVIAAQRQMASMDPARRAAIAQALRQARKDVLSVAHKVMYDAVREGERKTSAYYLTYWRKNNLDRALGMIFPYHYWMTHFPVSFTREWILKNPLKAFAAYRAMGEVMRDTEDLPWYRRLSLHVYTAPDGTKYYLDLGSYLPGATRTSMNMFNGIRPYEDEDATVFKEMQEAADSMGLGMNPLLRMGLTKTGALGDRQEQMMNLIPATRPIRAATGVDIEKPMKEFVYGTDVTKGEDTKIVVALTLMHEDALNLPDDNPRKQEALLAIDKAIEEGHGNAEYERAYRMMASGKVDENAFGRAAPYLNLLVTRSIWQTTPRQQKYYDYVAKRKQVMPEGELPIGITPEQKAEYERLAQENPLEEVRRRRVYQTPEEKTVTRQGTEYWYKAGQVDRELSQRIDNYIRQYPGDIAGKRALEEEYRAKKEGLKEALPEARTEWSPWMKTDEEITDKLAGEVIGHVLEKMPRADQYATSEEYGRAIDAYWQNPLSFADKEMLAKMVLTYGKQLETKYQNLEQIVTPEAIKEALKRGVKTPTEALQWAWLDQVIAPTGEQRAQVQERLEGTAGGFRHFATKRAFADHDKPTPAAALVAGVQRAFGDSFTPAQLAEAAKGLTFPSYNEYRKQQRAEKAVAGEAAPTTDKGPLYDVIYEAVPPDAQRYVWDDPDVARALEDDASEADVQRGIEAARIIGTIFSQGGGAAEYEAYYAEYQQFLDSLTPQERKLRELYGRIETPEERRAFRDNNPTLAAALEAVWAKEDEFRATHPLYAKYRPGFTSTLSGGGTSKHAARKQKRAAAYTVGASSFKPWTEPFVPDIIGNYGAPQSPGMVGGWQIPTPYPPVLR